MSISGVPQTQIRSRDKRLHSGNEPCLVCDIRARQVDELFTNCLKLEVEKQQMKTELGQMESAQQHQIAFIGSRFKELAEHQETELYELKKENRMLRERVDQLLRERTDQSQVLFEDNVLATVMQKTEQSSKEVKTNAVPTRFPDEGTGLTAGRKKTRERKEQPDQEIQSPAMLDQEAIKPEGYTARLPSKGTEVIEEESRETKTNAVIIEELKVYLTEATHMWQDSFPPLTTENVYEWVRKVRDLSDKKDLIVEAHDKAMALLTKEIDKVIQADEGLQRDEELQEYSMGGLARQDAKLDTQAEQLQSQPVVTDMMSDVERLTEDKAIAGKLSQEANEAQETEKQQADEVICQLLAKLARAENEIESLTTQVIELTEKQKEDRKHFKYEVSLEVRGARNLQKENEELRRKLQLKEKEGEQTREDAVRTMTQRNSPDLEEQSQPVASDSGILPSTQST
jgi:hypothetical protein